jgi:hypothetical protein
LIRAVEHNNSESKRSSEILCGLCFSSTSRALRRGTHAQVKSLGQGDVASICEWGDNESTAVADILVVVVGLPVANLRDTDSLLVLRALILHVESELSYPDEHALVLNLLHDKLLNDISLMDINGNDGDDLVTKIG